MRKQPFLSVVTRCYKRPNQLVNNIASLLAQTDQDYEHIFLKDDIGMGLEWANGQFARHTDKVHGRYVLMLDDDDLLTEYNLVADLKRITKWNPELVICRFDCGEFGILPTVENWEKTPELGGVGTSCLITRVDIWKDYIWSFESPRAGDFNFVSTLWPNLKDVVWFDLIIGRVQKNGYGNPE